jgi:hypothetical protein
VHFFHPIFAEVGSQLFVGNSRHRHRSVIQTIVPSCAFPRLGLSEKEHPMADPLPPSQARIANGGHDASDQQCRLPGAGPATESERNLFVEPATDKASARCVQASPGSIAAFQPASTRQPVHTDKKESHGDPKDKEARGSSGVRVSRKSRLALANHAEKTPLRQSERKGGIWDWIDNDNPVPKRPRTRVRPQPSALRDLLDNPVPAERTRAPANRIAHKKPAPVLAQQQAPRSRHSALRDLLDNSVPVERTQKRAPANQIAHKRPAPEKPTPALAKEQAPRVAAVAPRSPVEAVTPAPKDGIVVSSQHIVPQTHAENMKALRALKPEDLDRDDNDAAWRTINIFVAWANAPLTMKGERGWYKDVPQARVNDALLRLEQATRDLPLWLTAAVVKEAMRRYEAFYNENRKDLQNDELFVRGGDGPGGNPMVNITLFMTIADRVAGTPEGDDAVLRLVAIGRWPRGPSVRIAIGNGAALAYALAYARELEKTGATRRLCTRLSRTEPIFSQRERSATIRICSITVGPWLASFRTSRRSRRLNSLTGLLQTSSKTIRTGRRKMTRCGGA